MHERRLFERISANFPLRFLSPKTGREIKAETVNISANGVGLVTSESLACATSLEIWLDIPDHHEPLYAQGEVVWSQAVDSTNQQRVGILLKDVKLISLARTLWVKEKYNTYS